jgi:hypothetical protein
LNNNSDILGRGWTFGFKSKIYDDENSINKIVQLPDGSIQTYKINPNNIFVANDSRNTLTYDAVADEYTLVTKDNVQYKYNDGYLTKIIDKYSNEINLTVNSSGEVTEVTDYRGLTYTLTYVNSKLTER